MSEMKTTPNENDVEGFLKCVENKRRADDARAVAAMMARITGCGPKMWGDSIIGFGSYTYKRRDGSAHSYLLTGLSPRKAALTIYIMPGFSAYGDLLAQLGPHKHSRSCLYITRLDKVDQTVLAEIIRRSIADMCQQYPDAVA